MCGYRISGTVLSFVGICLVCLSQVADAATRQEVYAVLDDVQGNWVDVSLEVALNGVSAEPVVAVGDEVRYRLAASEPGYFVLMHVDSHGTATLIRPASETGVSGQPLSEYTFPPSGLIQAEPPLGKETVIAVMTDRPVTNEALGISGEQDFVQAEDSVQLVRQFRDAINRISNDSKVAVARLEYEVEGAAGTTEYTTRAIKRVFMESDEVSDAASTIGKSLPARIQFEFGSAVLTPEGKVNLDTFGEALLDPELRAQKYELAGHTDDVGAENYNESLSVERAKSAQRYLVNNFGIAPSRLEIKGYGETRPLSSRRDAESRARNRRVEFIRTE